MVLKRIDVLQAKEDALRFIRRVDEILELESPHGRTPRGKYNAAVKRASLDLTRSLAKMRQG